MDIDIILFDYLLMYKHTHSNEMVATKNKHKVRSCSTPERQGDSPSSASQDSDSICDSESASPVPFLCTQDGNEGETDVVWNFYTPKSENTAKSRVKNTTPLSHRSKRSLRPKVIEKHLPKRKALKISQKKTELFQDLLELNKNLHELIAKKPTPLPEKPQSGSEDDIFNEITQECSANCVPKNSSRCLRKNVLSSHFGRPDSDAALESDDSMNECLLKASQIVEDNIINYEPTAKRTRQSLRLNVKPDLNFKMDNDSMDAILNSIKLESPVVRKVKNYESPCINNNDSFDNIVGNLNDSALEQLTQIPNKSNMPRSKDWTVKELVVHDYSPTTKGFFGRHSSMPESPSAAAPQTIPSTSGMAFGRYNSMPFDNQANNNDAGDSPLRCTQDEIKKKHQLARDRLLAKRLLPFTSSPQSSTQLTQHVLSKKVQFQPKVPSNAKIQFQLKNATIIPTTNIPNQNHSTRSNKGLGLCNKNDPADIKLLIEKKRQEALMKLRRRQPQNK